MCLVFQLFLSFNTNGATECRSFYKENFTGNVLRSIGQIIEADPKNLEAALFEFSDLSLSQIKEQVTESSHWNQAFLKKYEGKLERFQRTFDKLIESNFLLSPLHQLAFLNATDKAFLDLNRGQTKYMISQDVIRKRDLKDIRNIISSDVEDSQMKREAIVTKMLNLLNDYIGSLPSKWLEMGEKEKYKFIKRLPEYRYVHFSKSSVSAFDTLYVLLKEPGGHEELGKVLEYTLSEIYSLTFAKARGPVGSTTKYVIPTIGGSMFFVGLFSLMGMVSPQDWLSYYVAKKDLMLLPLVSMGGMFGTAIQPLFRVGYDLPDLPGRIRGYFVKKSLTTDLTDTVNNRLKRDLNLEKDQLKAIETDDQLINTLDLDFNSLKAELRFNDLNGLISIGEWQRAFSNAVSKLSERTNLISEKDRHLNQLVDTAVVLAKRDDLSTAERIQLRGKLKEVEELVVNYYTQIIQFQMDLLYLASAFDRYDSKSQNVAERNNLAPSSTSLLITKRESLNSMKILLNSMAAFSMVKLNGALAQSQLIEEVTALSMSLPVILTTPQKK